MSAQTVECGGGAPPVVLATRRVDFLAVIDHHAAGLRNVAASKRGVSPMVAQSISSDLTNVSAAVSELIAAAKFNREALMKFAETGQPPYADLTKSIELSEAALAHFGGA